MGDAGARRIFLADTRGGDRHLRVSWHREAGTVVFSHWVDDVCVGSTPVHLDEASSLIELLVDALRERAAPGGHPSSGLGSGSGAA